ncbi:MAG: glycoside hydrolase family 127 protein [Eubacteriales bacterium]|nr:glycoside hydrolase family 127 protein [Eubacteriales bacterium]MDD3882013.1 glycoside hydrolase family 127 protein [Eubacteriales bacterium]MDD4513709.1 glycoside hydrolase family 127 protein [Eubacteriales bacterium]
MTNMIAGRNVVLLDGELRRRENENRAYMLRLTRENLMRNFMLEAGLYANASLDEHIHGGWESPTCQLRGHFTGHWLSAAAFIWAATGDTEIKGRADAMVEDLRRCQIENGDGWAGSIPEKYLDWVARGKPVWAPHYTLHKTLMGLVDMARLTGNKTALEIADSWSEWFDNWTAEFTREQMNDILDVETGGMLEEWVELYAMTGSERYLRLIKRYDRPRLFDELLKGNDPLTNMHANTTIPEILGCARAYEVTKEERYRKIVEAYWKCAVTDRGAFATGGQTCGEIWNPKGDSSARLGRKAQEHCTVYNMMRLADFLFRWTKDSVYADYIERNLYNGIMAQGYYQWRGTNGYTPDHPDKGLIAYFMPMCGGDHKGWGTETTDFFCCHGTLVQANAALNKYIYYQDGQDVYVCQFFDSDAEFALDGRKVTLMQRIDTQSGSFHLSSDSAGKQSIGAVTSKVVNNPETLRVVIKVKCESPVKMRLNLRVPFWAQGMEKGFRTFEKEVWNDGDVITFELPRTLWSEPLCGDDTRAAIMYGPMVLAGLVDSERRLHVDSSAPHTALRRANEREWGNWTNEFITVTEDETIRFIPLCDVGYEPYAVYFRVK